MLVIILVSGVTVKRLAKVLSVGLADRFVIDMAAAGLSPPSPAETVLDRSDDDNDIPRPRVPSSEVPIPHLLLKTEAEASLKTAAGSIQDEAAASPPPSLPGPFPAGPVRVPEGPLAAGLIAPGTSKEWRMKRSSMASGSSSKSRKVQPPQEILIVCIAWNMTCCLSDSFVKGLKP